jgi:hypothetical protein
VEGKLEQRGADKRDPLETFLVELLPEDRDESLQRPEHSPQQSESILLDQFVAPAKPEVT